MKVIILAAGFATRLRPLTTHFPKALLPLFGRPILDYSLDPLSVQLPHSQYALVTNAVYHQAFLDWQHTQPDLSLTILNNSVTEPESRLGAIGDLLYTLDQLEWDDDLLVLASDTLTSLNWSDFLAFIRTHPTRPSTVVYPTADRALIANKLGCAVVTDERLTAFIEKPTDPPTNLMAVPYYYFPREILPSIRHYATAGNQLDSPGSLLPHLIAQTEFYAFTLPASGYYYDVGTLAVYEALQASHSLL